MHWLHVLSWIKLKILLEAREGVACEGVATEGVAGQGLRDAAPVPSWVPSPTILLARQATSGWGR